MARWPTGTARSIVATTAYDQPGDLDRAIRSGVAAYLVKPVDGGQVERTLSPGRLPSRRIRRDAQPGPHRIGRLIDAAELLP